MRNRKGQDKEEKKIPPEPHSPESKPAGISKDVCDSHLIVVQLESSLDLL